MFTSRSYLSLDYSRFSRSCVSNPSLLWITDLNKRLNITTILLLLEGREIVRSMVNRWLLTRSEDLIVVDTPLRIVDTVNIDLWLKSEAAVFLDVLSCALHA